MKANQKAISAQVAQETEVLCRVSTAFPFDLFPDEVIVDRTKISIVTNHFLGSQEIKTLAIKDIFSVEVDATPFLSTVRLFNRMPMIPEIVIAHLKTRDALLIQRVIHGLLIAKAEKITVDELSPDQTLSHLKRLGGTHSKTL